MKLESAAKGFFWLSLAGGVAVQAWRGGSLLEGFLVGGAIGVLPFALIFLVGLIGLPLAEWRSPTPGLPTCRCSGTLAFDDFVGNAETYGYRCLACEQRFVRRDEALFVVNDDGEEPYMTFVGQEWTAGSS